MIISFSGRRGSGKSTVAKLVAEQLGFRIDHLATQLRTELVELGMPDGLMDTQEGKASTIVWEGQATTARKVMCTHGAKRYQEDPEWLIKGVLTRSHGANTVVDDVRRKTEAQALARFGPVIRIEHYDTPLSQEITEIDLDNWPYFDMEMFPQFGELRIVAFHICRQLAPIFTGRAGLIYTKTAQLITD